MKQSAKGYITISVALILTLSISLCLTLIEGCRRSTSILVAECAVDTGMNNILAEYHRELLGQYGLFFVDTSYGTAVPDYTKVLGRLEEYVGANLGQDESLLNIFSEDFIGLYWSNGEVLGLSVSSDEGGAVLRRQISEYMEEQTGTAYLMEVLDWLDIIEDYQLTGDWYGELEYEAEKTLQDWSVLSEDEESEKKEDSLGYYDGLLKKVQEGVLHLALGLEDISNAAISEETYLSHRELLRGSGMNPAVEFADNDWDRLLLCEYILSKTGHYKSEKIGSCLQYQTEYILYGQESDVENLLEAADALFAVRETANAVHIFLDRDKMDLLRTLSEELSAAMGVPEISPLLQTMFVVIWAGFESLWDVARLLEGEEIALLKNEWQWHYDLEFSAQKAEEAGKDNILLCYEDYLRIFLMLQDKQVITYRLMDVMEMDIRQTAGNEYFRMDACVDSVTVDIELVSGYGYEFAVTRNYGY